MHFRYLNIVWFCCENMQNDLLNCTLRKLLSDPIAKAGHLGNEMFPERLKGLGNSRPSDVKVHRDLPFSSTEDAGVPLQG